MSKVSELTSNQFYGGLNRRFEKRAKRLRAMGFTYKIVAPGIAAFIRERYGRVKSIAAAEVASACNRVFWDHLRTF